MGVDEKQMEKFMHFSFFCAKRETHYIAKQQRGKEKKKNHERFIKHRRKNTHHEWVYEIVNNHIIQHYYLEGSHSFIHNSCVGGSFRSGDIIVHHRLSALQVHATIDADIRVLRLLIVFVAAALRPRGRCGNGCCAVARLLGIVRLRRRRAWRVASRLPRIIAAVVRVLGLVLMFGFRFRLLVASSGIRCLHGRGSVRTRHLFSPDVRGRR
jgi:hypothetical protein